MIPAYGKESLRTRKQSGGETWYTARQIHPVLLADV